jgi:pyridinium-3,5-biscarboxylic acid mononucleotide sulfurtransferase
LSPSKKQTLIQHLRSWQPGVVAFSGGVDSTLLLALAREAWQAPPLALTFVSPLMTAEELNRIRNLAQGLEVPLIEVKSREYQHPSFRKNPVNRCYYCKQIRFQQGKAVLKKLHRPYLLDGTNADDLKVYRPGIRASQEAGVISPFALLGWGKKPIRQLSRRMGLANWDLPSAACLASRIAYGQPITLPLLRRVAAGEALLRSLGLKELRLRIHGPLTRIEVPEKDIPLIVNQETRIRLRFELANLGFTYITLDLEGLRSGSMDEQRLKKAGRGKGHGAAGSFR